MFSMGLTNPGAATPRDTIPGDADGRLPVFPFGRAEPPRYGAFRAYEGGIPAAVHGAGHGIPGHDAFPHLFSAPAPASPPRCWPTRGGGGSGARSPAVS